MRVAGWVEAAIGRADGMLFTATPTQDLDEVIVWQQLANQVFAGMLRTLTAACNRASTAERFWVGDEVALAIGASAGTGSALVLLAAQACELPGLVEAVEDNLLTERHLRAVLPVLHDVQLIWSSARRWCW